MDGRPTWTDCDEAGDYVVPNVLSPRDLVSRPDVMDETVPRIRRTNKRNKTVSASNKFSDQHASAHSHHRHIASCSPV